MKSAGYLIVSTLLIGSAVYAQGFGPVGRARYPRMALANSRSFDGDWHFCRLAYQGRSWGTDYPDADYNFSTRLSELTKTRVSKKSSGEANPLIVRPIDDALFQCPFVMIWQADSLYFSDEDAARLRAYLLKGGFIWADDFWGTYAWENFATEMAKVMRPPQHSFIDIPLNHSLHRMLFEVKKVPQVPGISFWWRSGGRTSEQGADSAEVHVRGMLDDRGRVMVLATHNTDIADGWEREGVDVRYFYEFSVNSYAVGINIALYALTH